MILAAVGALCCALPARAEEQAILNALPLDELGAYAAAQGVDFGSWIMSALSGEMDLSRLLSELYEAFSQAFLRDIRCIGGMVTPMLVLLMLRLILPGKETSRRTAAYFCRVSCFSALATAFVSMCGVAHTLMQDTLECFQCLTPVMIAATALSGAEGTATILSPAAALCANAIQLLLDQWGIALSCAAAGIAFAGNLSANIRLKRLHGLFRQILHWGAGGIMTAFMALLSVQGRLGAGRDSVAARTAHFAIESIVPVIGGNVSDSLDSLLSTAYLVKNAVGAAGLFLIVFVSLSPMIRLLGSSMILRAVSALSEPLGDEPVTTACAQFADAVEMLLIVAVAGVVLCGLLVGSCMSAANNIVH